MPESSKNIHHLCLRCVNTCRQNAMAKILHCPNFIKKPSDEEFRDLIKKLEEAEAEAELILKKSHELVILAGISSSNVTDGDSSESWADIITSKTEGKVQ